MLDRCLTGIRKKPFLPKRAAPAALALVLLTGFSPLLQGCGPTVAAGAAVGIATVEERGLGGAVSDTEIRIRINELWFDASEVLLRQIRLQVHSGRVLLTGVLSTPELRDQAVRLAWKAKNVKEVINEVKVGDTDGVIDLVKDSTISGALRIKILADPKIRSLNYSVEATDGTIYLLGIAQSQEELDRVINHARTIKFVRRVISHVNVKKA